MLGQEKPKNYYLHAILMHMGSPDFGHFWSYILDRRTNQWWRFDDSRVTKSKWSTVEREARGGDATKSRSIMFFINEELKKEYESSESYWMRK